MNADQGGMSQPDGTNDRAVALGLDIEDPWAFALLSEMEYAEGLVERKAPSMAVVQGVEIRAGSRVRLHPHRGGDIMDLALAGKVAIIEAIEQDFEDQIHLAVTIEDDPGRDLGDARQPGHRFFFALEEVEPLIDAGGERT